MRAPGRRGRLAEAEATLAKLEALNPRNPALPTLRAEIQRQRSGGSRSEDPVQTSSAQ
ncbi:MAG TPA: hypothetical protein VGV38_02795 [Pyrinomonadaceae bacterium]|nr:hypothetical protein [Pyrinomonadaceae bacterium]